MNIPQQIIEPVNIELLLAELTEDKLLRPTTNGGNLIYLVTAACSPNVMDEIGRLREISFRASGGGTGMSKDIDQEDLAPDGYKQLIVWNPQDQEIIGGYRYIVSCKSDTKHLSTEHYFRFSETFRQNYLPYMIELGRSFVQPKYQGRQGGMKSIYALDNLWDGVGALAFNNPGVRYYFGKVTMYDSYHKEARNTLIYFLKKYFPDNQSLLEPIYPIHIDYDEQKMQSVFTGGSYNEDYKILSKELKSFGENIPPLINSYMNLSPSMIVFDTVCNPDFGDVEETAILITISDIYKEKSARYIKC